jgi:hypothetical protein
MIQSPYCILVDAIDSKVIEIIAGLNGKISGPENVLPDLPICAIPF